jgi:uncharacterized membrane protein YfcA
MENPMKLRIAAATLGLGGLLFVPATHAFGELSPQQSALCTAAVETRNALLTAQANLEPGTRAYRKVHHQIAVFDTFIARNDCPTGE